MSLPGEFRVGAVYLRVPSARSFETSPVAYRVTKVHSGIVTYVVLWGGSAHEDLITKFYDTSVFAQDSVELTAR